MTALAAVGAAATGGPSAVERTQARAEAILGWMDARGDSGSRESHSLDAPAAAVTLTATMCAWEREVHPGAGQLSWQSEACTVLADASLFYRNDLRRAIGVREADAPGAAALIARTYAREGSAGFARLEGDFATILWDAREQALVAARDFTGRRTLFYAERPDALLIASSIGALLVDPAVPPDLDLATVASVAAGLWSHPAATAYRAIREVPAGHVLRWRPGRAAEIHPFWEAPASIPSRRRPIDDAASELRELLVSAVDERVPGAAPAGLSLSGGWDSTAVYGAGREALRRRPADDRSLVPVSISYPPGDPGREDEFIAAVVSHWGSTAHLIPVDDIPIWDDPWTEAAQREQPFAHTYERWNRRLFQAARARGARVMLDGAGGDQLFQVSDIYLSDLARTGQWIELARQSATRRALGWKHLWRWAIRPVLPTAVTETLARLRRMEAPTHHLARREPGWFRHGFLREHDVPGRDAAAAPVLPPGVLGELHAYLRYPFFARVFGLMTDIARDEGLEPRSPLLDQRIVRFSASRPWSDRADRHETKRVLRRAMRGLLPDVVLASRPQRTGITTAYFFRQLRSTARPTIDALLQDPFLASLGMIDATRLRDAWAHLQRHDDSETAARLWFTVQAELWLRAHASGAGA